MALCHRQVSATLPRYIHTTPHWAKRQRAGCCFFATVGTGAPCREMLLRHDGFPFRWAPFRYISMAITLGYESKIVPFPADLCTSTHFSIFRQWIFFFISFYTRTFVDLCNVVHVSSLLFTAPRFFHRGNRAQTRKANATLVLDILFEKRASRIGEKRHGSRCKAHVDILVRIVRSGRSFRGDSSFDD